MFTDPHTGNRGRNREISRARLICLRIADGLGIQRVDMTHASAHPELVESETIPAKEATVVSIG